VLVHVHGDDCAMCIPVSQFCMGLTTFTVQVEAPRRSFCILSLFKMRNISQFILLSQRTTRSASALKIILVSVSRNAIFTVQAHTCWLLRTLEIFTFRLACMFLITSLANCMKSQHHSLPVHTTPFVRRSIENYTSACAMTR
jgi:hypothetical protein